MADRVSVSSLRQTARVGGILYLVVIVSAFFAELFVRSSLIVPNDAVATAQKILASERLYRLGGLADLINLSCDVALAIILYRLLWPAGKTIAFAAAAFRLVFDAGLAVATFFHFAPLTLLNNNPSLAAMPLPERQALAFDMIKLHDLGYNVCMLFFGLHLLLLGWLSLRSRLIPRWIGLLLVLTFLCYWANSIIHLVFPEIPLSPFVLLPGLVTELALAFWLLAGGVNVARWRALAQGEGPGLERTPG